MGGAPSIHPTALNPIDKDAEIRVPGQLHGTHAALP
jgi:hypothetical protein